MDTRHSHDEKEVVKPHADAELLTDSLPAEEAVVDIADFFKVFGDATRLKILFLLEAKDEVSVNAIAETLKMQQSAISQQLKLLRSSRLVRWRKVGRFIYYRLNDEHISRILAMGAEHYHEAMS
ncbi:ArsR/SmtB family transcription factor [Parasphaerochaeta coccoides]|uniref:Regulatory protein ArsR n=1 Tax=Parasphaerochaeta coccoides (strain ATCC BAA-1237 / DSM 17374 / SPN1) TaxID=760011 RepID=F4GLG8_PARC1|nr:metalloregulator ArsR/SmtB family transcription factor [Parasphaerochaeta coccoides]AEC01938.1 regulatory protein ArsR [Parasphaerochaeta coccoides DSM 17374]